MSTEIKFNTFKLDNDILEAISKKGFETPSEIQAKVIPLILEQKNDIIGIAQTGTGKTAAFGLPSISLLKPTTGTPQILILAPTRELALQVTEELKSFLGKKKAKIMTVYGGAPISTQVSELRRGADVVVGTPGRVVDMIKRGALDLSSLDHFILDEADEMLNMGFVDDLEFIFGSGNNKKKVYLFSATMPKKIRELAKKYMRETTEIRVERKEEAKRNIDQKAIIVKHSHKESALITLASILDPFYAIVFCKTKQDVEEVTQSLKQHKILASCIHGDIAQNKREKILQQFRDFKLDVLVATDVAARGIDIEHLTHVINYSIPQELETYVHRIGRVGRAGKTGTSITFVTPRETRVINELERITKTSITMDTLPTRDDIEAKKIEELFSNMGEIIHSGDEFKRERNLIKTFSEVERESILLASLRILINKSIPKAPVVNLSKGDDEPRDSRRSGGNRSRSGSRDSRGSSGGYRGNREGGSRDSRGSSGGYRGNREGSSRDSRGSSGGYKGNREGSSRDSRGSSGGYKGNREGGSRDSRSSSSRKY